MIIRYSMFCNIKTIDNSVNICSRLTGLWCDFMRRKMIDKAVSCPTYIKIFDPSSISS